MTTQPQLAEEVLSLSIRRTTGDSHRRAGARAPRRRRPSCAPGGWSTASRPPRALSGHASWLRLGAGLHGAELLRPAFAKEPTRSVVETRLRHHSTAAWVAERPTLGAGPAAVPYALGLHGGEVERTAAAGAGPGLGSVLGHARQCIGRDLLEASRRLGRAAGRRLSLRLDRDAGASWDRA
jgi:hypothetical protein